MNMHKPPVKQAGFTIVELLIVIVVIAILATLTIVAYNGIQQRTHVAVIQSDLNKAINQLGIDNVNNGTYPVSAAAANGGQGLKASPGTTWQYTYTSAGNSYCITGTNGSVSNFSSTANPAPQAGACPGDANGGVAVLTCPTGFIVVPGSATYGTSDFCTMKYAASQVGTTTTPISQAGTIPWINISQTTAISYSPNVAGCTGCHLITEPEFMTIAQNVLSVASNWSGGAVGSGFIYSGNSDGAPTNMLAADPSDANGYSGTGNSSPSNQRRTLTLTNGEVIWDLAGNVWEWTAGTSTTGQPGITGEPSYAWKDWPNVTAAGSLAINPSPAGTNLTGANTWNSSQGIGQLCSWAGESAVRGFLRGAAWSNSGLAGVLTLNLSAAPSLTSTTVGFRVSR